MIDSLRVDYSITELCDALDVSPSGYYAARRRTPSPRHQLNQVLLTAMHAIHQHRHTRAYGSPRMTRELRAQGLRASENRVARLMRDHHLRARPRRPFRPKTTRPDHAACPSPNLLAAAPPPQAPGTHLVSDITYIPTREGWLYLVIILDLFSRAVIAWRLAPSLHAAFVVDALRRALASRRVAPGALFHSDRGCQYTATTTRAALAAAGLRQSMSAAGCCYDNAFAESTFASLKHEILPEHQPFASFAHARLAVFDYLETFYNRRRLHSALGYRTPLAILDSHFPKPQPSLT